MKNKMVKIIDKRNMNNPERFGNLSGGATFLWDKALFMKVCGCVCGYNEAISLVDGCITEFDDSDNVLPVDIEINIIK